MLSYEAELRDHARRLFDDVGPLHTVSVLGFVEEEPDVVEVCLDVLSRGQGAWSFLDLRSLEGDAAKDQVRLHLQSQNLVVVISQQRPPLPIINLVRATIDRSPRLELGDLVEETRRPDQSIVVVVEGVSAHDDLHPELRRVPYEDLIP